MAACTSPSPEYRFTADQLAWQPYQEGQVLRFGNSQTAAVRTYRVTRILDNMDRQSSGWRFKSQPSFQRIGVFMQRADSLGNEFYSLGMHFDFSSPAVVPGNEWLVNASLEWDTPPEARLPIDELNQGLPLDTTRYYGVRLLPVYTLGPATYTAVVRYRLTPWPNSNVSNPTTALYLTKTNGVVGFVQRNTLWYRIP